MTVATRAPQNELSGVRLTVSEWEAMLREPVRDRRYLSTQLGSAVADYLSWKKNEDGATAATLDSYERELARLCVSRPATGPRDLTIDDLRAVRDTYPEGSRFKVTSIYRDFCKWLYEESRTDQNVAGRLRFPKRHAKPITDLFNDEEKAAIVTAASGPRARACLLLLLRAGLRKGELRQLRRKDIDLVDRYVLVRRGKGGKMRRVPIRGAVIRALDELFITESVRPDDHILVSETRPDPSRPFSDRGTHEWWYRCLQRAGVVDKGVTSGRRTHTTRHTYATDLGRATRWNMLAVQKNLGHSRIATTIDIYTQFAFEDQEQAVEALAEIDPLEA